VREAEQLRFRLIMVDEFQDTNRLQCELIDALAGGPADAPSWGAAGGAGPEGTVRLSTGPESPVPPAASGGGGAGLRPAGAAAGEGRA
jgi:superfamily I DNA/RNA helicase